MLNGVHGIHRKVDLFRSRATPNPGDVELITGQHGFEKRNLQLASQRLRL